MKFFLRVILLILLISPQIGFGMCEEILQSLSSEDRSRMQKIDNDLKAKLEEITSGNGDIDTVKVKAVRLFLSKTIRTLEVNPLAQHNDTVIQVCSSFKYDLQYLIASNN